MGMANDSLEVEKALVLYGNASKLYGFLNALALSQDDEAAQGTCEFALYANGIAIHFREQLEVMMGDAKE